MEFGLAVIFVAGHAMVNDVNVIQNYPAISIKVYNLTLQIHWSNIGVERDVTLNRGLLLINQLGLKNEYSVLTSFLSYPFHPILTHFRVPLSLCHPPLSPHYPHRQMIDKHISPD